MATRTNNNKTYYINPAYLTFNENSGYGANLIQVSASSSCWISVYDKANGINYSDADKNYKRWKVTAYNNKFPDNDAYRIYVRLERNGTSALIVYSKKVYHVDGSSAETEASADYYYIYIGDVSTTDGTSIRSITYDTGYLESDQGYEDANELTEMWELDKYTTPWLIKAKQWLADFTVKGFISLVGGLIFKNGEEEKTITDIKRSTDNDDEVPVSDESLPTTKYINNIIEDLDDRFLRKDQDDRSKGAIASDKGFEVGNFESGTLGMGASMHMDESGNTYVESDYLKIRKKATFTNITVQELKHIGGELIISPAFMVCSRVEEASEGYKCYFNQTDSDGRKVYNEFEVGDQARCQTFNLENNTYYWRLVTSIGDDFIVLSKTDCDTGSDIPKAGDNISQLGNRNDATRQSAIVLSAYGEDAPSYKQYEGIDSYVLSEDMLVTKLSPKGNYIRGKFISEATGADYDSEFEQIRVDWDRVLAQTDKEFTMWFYGYEPTMENAPAVDWVTEELRMLHDQDLFYDTASGLAYRFEFIDGVWTWSNVTDLETIKALEAAAKAQGTADKVTERLELITMDGILSALEKKEVLKEWESLVAGYWANDTAAENFGLTFSNDDTYYQYYKAFTALGTYLNGSESWAGAGTPLWLADLSTDQVIDAAEYRTRWKNYYDKENVFLSHLSEIAKDKANDAQADADKANGSIEEMASDGILSAVEKKEVLKEWESVVAAYAKNVANANNYNVSTTSYTIAYHALGTYLNNAVSWTGTGTPAWLADLSTNQPISPEYYRKVWVDYYNAEIALLEAVSNAINQKAEDAQGSADEAKEDAGTKKRVFVAQPTSDSVYDVGDLWVNATFKGEIVTYDNDVLVCVTSKKKGAAFNISHWEPASGYSESISTLKVEAKEIKATVATSQEAANKAKEIAQNVGWYSGEEYNQTENPWTKWSSGTEYKHVGAIWYNPSTKVTKRYIGYDGTNTWEDVTDTNLYESATFVLQNKDKWAAIATKFDENGNPTSTSGFVTEANYSQMFSEAWEDNEKVRAEISTFATIDPDTGYLTSGIRMFADEINFYGQTIINKKFWVDTNGNVFLEGDLTLASMYRKVATGSSSASSPADLTSYSGFVLLGYYSAPVLKNSLFTELVGLWISQPNDGEKTCRISFATAEVVYCDGIIYSGVDAITFTHNGGYIKVKMLGYNYSTWGGQCWSVSVESSGTVSIDVDSPNS